MPSIDVLAPLAGVVKEISSACGKTVTKGDLLCTLESMKVHVRVEAEQACTVESVDIAAGDNVNRGACLFTLQPVIEDTVNNNSIRIETASDSDIPNNNSFDNSTSDIGPAHSSLSTFKERQALSLDGARQQAIEKRHSKGYLSARENLANLCDVEHFQEYGQFAVAAQRDRKDYQTLKSSTAADGIITGVGHVNGHSAALVVNDYSVLAGTQGFFHHQKLDRILAVAQQQNLPVIMFTEGGGGRPGDTDVTVVNSGLLCSSFALGRA